MKTKKVLLVISLASAALLSSCIKNGFPCVKGHGSLVEETRSTETFTEVELDIAGDVYLTQDSTIKSPTVIIETHENILERVRTSSDGHTLRINDKGNCIKNYSTLNVYITLPDLEGVSVNGSGNIKSKTPFQVNSMDFEINGSGNIEFDVTSQVVDIDINGGGDVDLQGKTQDLFIDVSGSGDIYAYDLEAYECNIDINGSGSVETFVTDFLNVEINGSGSVRYDGDAKNITVSSNGSGTVARR